MNVNTFDIQCINYWYCHCSCHNNCCNSIYSAVIKLTRLTLCSDNMNNSMHTYTKVDKITLEHVIFIIGTAEWISSVSNYVLKYGISFFTTPPKSLLHPFTFFYITSNEVSRCACCSEIQSLRSGLGLSLHDLQGQIGLDYLLRFNGLFAVNQHLRLHQS